MSTSPLVGMTEQQVRDIVHQELQRLGREALPASMRTKSQNTAEQRVTEKLNLASRARLTLDDIPPAVDRYLSVDANGFATYKQVPYSSLSGPLSTGGVVLTGNSISSDPAAPVTAPWRMGGDGTNVLPRMTTAQRPGAPLKGEFHWNETTSSPEVWNGSAYRPLGAPMESFALYTALREARRAALGTTNPYLVSWPYDPTFIDQSVAGNALGSARVFLVPQIVPAGQAIDGVLWMQMVSGSYTAVNSNQVAAYTFDGTTFTRVAQSVSDAALWTLPAPQQQAKAFSSQLAAFASDTLVWAAGLWNRSAVVTAPQILSPATPAALVNMSLGVYSFEMDLTGQANMPASFLASAGTLTNAGHPWLCFYRSYA